MFIFDDVNEEIKMLKRNKLIQHFTNHFNIEIIKDIQSELTCDILDKSLSSSISQLPFETFVKLFDELFTFTYDIDVFTCGLKYFKHYINSKLLSENLQIAFNKRTKYIEFMLDKYTCTSPNISSYDDFMLQMSYLTIMQHIIAKLITIQKNS